jgi:hypothetical protein
LWNISWDQTWNRMNLLLADTWESLNRSNSATTTG